MTSAPATKSSGQFVGLQRLYVEEALDDVTRVEGSLASALLEPEGEAWLRVCKTAHDLRGTGGSYGFPLVSEHAGRFEDALARGAGSDALLGILRGLRAALHEAGGGVGVSTREPAGKGSGWVIDDDPHARALVELVLDRLGLSACVFDAGERALESLASGAAAAPLPTLILIDKRLPGITGLEVIRRLRRLAGIESVPIVVLSADGSLGGERDALAAGATAFMSKPFKLSTLELTLRKLLSGAAFESK